MTSIELFRNDEPKAYPQPEPPEWGTGKLLEKPKVNLWAPKAATWIYTGEPTQQHYTLTQLKLSNVRLNDQLLPRPQDCEMGKMMIQKPFPAEHPYASHMSRFAVFPKFDTPEDAKRGFAARDQLPKNPEMPSQPYDVTIVRKVKGNAFRHEQQALPPESMKEALQWHDGDRFDQLVKSPWGGQQPYYPTPPKIFNPNLDPRDDNKLFNPNIGNMQISADAANATRNVEREQWQTTYDLNHTGLGPANVRSLDNMEDKEHRKRLTGYGKDEDDLHTREVRTFDPPRPVEGRIARALVPAPPPQTDKWPNPEPDPTYRRKMTLTEREEDRLWNGKQYAQLPYNNETHQWRTLDHQNHPLSGLKTMEEALSKAGKPDPVPYVPAGQPPAPCTEATYLDGLLKEQQDRHQQIEAQNRWRQLESQTPAHNVGARQRKVDMQVDKTQPETFYRHEGKYNRERAGLYKTSYDPYSLQHSMNKDQEAGSEVFYTMDSHKDALNSPLDINNQMGELMREGRTLGNPGSVPQLHDQSAPHEVFGSYNKLKSIQKSYLQPSFNSADVKTQENGVVLVESTYGDGYNTQKFLQENSLPAEARKEPILLMSNQNQDLKKTKMTATPKTGRSVQFSGNVTVASGAGAEPIRLVSAPINSLKADRVSSVPRPETSSGVPIRTTNTVTDGSAMRMPASGRQQSNNMYASLPVSLDQARKAERLGSTNLFNSKSTNVTPGTRRSWNNNSAYSDLFPGNNHVDMSFKNDKRFDWMPGCGTPRPQTDLIRIQDSFSKSDARRRFHEKFPEKNPDLRENLISGKKHVFVGGLNAQVLRGTPLVS